MKFFRILLLIVFSIGFSETAKAQCTGVNEADSLWLVDFYNSTGGSNWTDNSNWLTGPVSSWYGIELTSDQCNVMEIDLGGNQLNGEFPSAIPLAELVTCYLHSNEISGSIPSLDQVPKLRELTLFLNNLSGTIPSLANLPLLEYISLRNNGLQGEIPSFINNLRLQRFVVTDNLLTGSLPSFENVPLLEMFRVSSNELTGTIPDVSNLTNLEFFNVFRNDLSGIVPSFSGSTNLSQLNLAENSFTSADLIDCIIAVPINTSSLSYHPQDSIYQDTTINILEGENLDLELLVDEGLASNSHQWYKNGVANGAPIQGDNNLTINNISTSDAGVYRVEITNPNTPDLTLYSHDITVNVTPNVSCLQADSLWLVDFYNSTGGPNWTDNSNWLTGPVNSWYGITLTADGCGVSEISLLSNNLIGSIESIVLPSLVGINLGNNNINGSIPLLDQVPQLTSFSIASNDLIGSIPPLDQVPNLDLFSVSGNRLTGSIPSLDKVPNLKTFNLSFNPLSGTIPSLDQVPNLQSFSVANNQLIGSIPSLNQVSELEFLYVYSNQLTGSIPALDRVPNLTVFRADFNRLSGIIPNLSQLPNLKTFWIDQNLLTGTIPSLDQVSNLESFYVSNNQLTGSIPSLDQVPNLESFIASNNRISGSIPSLDQLPLLRSFWVNVNNLTGSVPELDQLNNLESFVISENRLEGNFSDLAVNTNIDQLQFEDNLFTFSDFLSQILSIQDQLSTLTYHPQDSIYQDTTITVLEGENLDLDLLVDEGLASNSYQWYKDGIVNGAPILGDNNLTINNITPADAGLYRVEITNPNAPDLTLYSRDITVNVLPNTSCLEADSLWLANFYNDTNGPSWTNNDNWLTGPVSTWHGITLTDDGCGVKEISLVSNGIEGSIDSMTLPFLEGINLDSNRISGSIPLLDQVPRLTSFSIASNELTSEIPDLDQIPNLEYFNVSYNQLTGPIPTLNLPELATFICYWNQMTGPLPTLDQIPSLEHFGVDHNQFTGGVPTFDQVPLLRIFAIQNNLLTGPLPALDQVPNLFDFSASDNQLTGTIPPLDQVPQLNSFWVPNNDLSGTVPQITQMPNLTAFVISENSIGGDFSDLSLNADLDLLLFESNEFTFSNILTQIQSVEGQLTDLFYQPQDSVYKDTIINLTTGQSFDLDLFVDEGLSSNSHQWYKDGATMNTPIEGDNNLKIENAQESDEGVYRVEITNPGLPDLTLYSHDITINVQPSCLEADSLWLVDFYNSTGGPNWTRNDNWLIGPVNGWYGIILTDDGCGVKEISLAENLLRGTIATLSLPQLTFLDLSSNQLSGELFSLSAVPNLERFSVFDNQLSGSIPSLDNVPKLTDFAVDRNQLSGNLPTLNKVPLLETFLAGNNLLSSSIPVLDSVQELESFFVFGNDLSGSIPSLDNVPNLRGFGIDGNRLSGPLPALNNVPNLESFFANNNLLEGEIPSLQSMPNLQAFRVSSNNLTGDWPSLNSLTNLDVLHLSENAFTFSNIIPQVSQVSSEVSDLIYQPQDSIYRDTTITIVEGEDLDLDLLVDEGLTSNSYQWYKDDVIFGNPIQGENNFRIASATQADAGIYHVEITNPELPDLTLISRTITVIVQAVCDINATADDACPEDETITLRVSSPATDVSYRWLSPQGNLLTESPSESFEVTEDGTYTVELIKDGCNTSTTVSATRLSVTPSGLDESYEYCPEETDLYLEPNNFESFNWSFGGQQISIDQDLLSDLEGQYQFEGLNPNGCLTRDTVEVLFYCEPDEIIINNVMTPNGDGQGDFLIIDGIAPNKEVRITLFNRWGRELYRFKGNYKNNWDGKLPNGRRLKPGNYLCVVEEGDRETAQVISVL